MQLLTLVPSPNNIKVRVALAFKGIPFEELPQDPADRGAMLESSGQALTPVLKHEGVVMFDSAAILRYLHANFPGPALFPRDYDAMKKVENWEAFGRYGVKDSLGAMFAMTFGNLEATAENIAAAKNAFLEHTESVERKLQQNAWLVGDAMTAADITLASLMVYNVLHDHPVVQGSFFGPSFAERFALETDQRPALQAWVKRVVSLDPWLSEG